MDERIHLFQVPKERALRTLLQPRKQQPEVLLESQQLYIQLQ